jgi:hypothetical protein
MSAVGQMLVDKFQNPPVLFKPPHQGHDSIEGSLVKYAKNLRAVRSYIAQTSIISHRTDHVTSSSPVNDVVEYSHIVSLAEALKTQFADAQKDIDKPKEPSTIEKPKESSTAQGRPQYHLDLSNMESIGILPAFLDTQGKDDANFTVYGTLAHSPLPQAVARSIAMVFTYPKSVLVRINQHLSAVLHLAWDVTPYLDDLNITLPAYHLYQLLCAFFFNRAQIGKVEALKSAGLLGYGEVVHGHQLVRLIKDISLYSFIFFVLGQRPDSPLVTSDSLFITQAFDGLQRTAHQLPEHVRPIFQKTLHRLSERLQNGHSVSRSTMLISLGALLPSSTDPT